MLYVGSNQHATNDTIFKHLNIDANLHLTTNTELYELVCYYNATNDTIFKHLNIDANLHLTTNVQLYEFVIPLLIMLNSNI